MYINNLDGFINTQLHCLSELFELIDNKLSSIDLSIQQSTDPESDGYFDRAEYFIGVGFVAAQQYLVDTLLFTKLNKNIAYQLGPIHPNGVTYANLINSCANWWKHEAEWYEKQKVPKKGMTNFANVVSTSEQYEYALSSVLATICPIHELPFKYLTQYLIEWRNAVITQTSDQTP